MADFLIDTHVFLWWQHRSGLSRAAAEAIADPENRIFVSAASIWEIAIKAKTGKLTFAASPFKAIAANGFFELPILPIEAEAAGLMAGDLSDPFDRALVAQALRLNLTFVTADKAIRHYPGLVQLWAGA